MKKLTMFIRLLTIVASISLSSVTSLYDEFSMSSQFNTNVTAPEDLAATGHEVADVGLTSAFKKTKKVIQLTRKGNFFVFPISVGTPAQNIPVRLSLTLSTPIALFPEYYDSSKSKTYAVEHKANSKKNSVQKIRQKIDGTTYNGIAGNDAVVVGGIHMKHTPVYVLEKKPGDNINGFGGVIGLGTRGKQPGVKQGILYSMMAHSKTMDKARLFSLYICKGGQAGQLQLGGLDKKLMIKGTSPVYVTRHNTYKGPPQKRYLMYQEWAVHMHTVKLNGIAIQKAGPREAIFDSTSPYIAAPKKELEELLEQASNKTTITWRTHGRDSNAVTVPIIPCTEKDTLGILKLHIDRFSVTFTVDDMLRGEVEDQQAHPGMCELFFSVTTSQKEPEQWRLGIPFLEMVGITIFDKANLRIGFAPKTAYSKKICGGGGGGAEDEEGGQGVWRSQVVSRRKGNSGERRFCTMTRIFPRD